MRPKGGLTILCKVSETSTSNEASPQPERPTSVASEFANLTQMISIRVPKAASWLWCARILWFLPCLAILVLIFLNDNVEIQIVYAMLMMFLTAPAGMLVMAACETIDFWLSDTFGITIPGNAVFTVLVWGLIVAAGYLQWFKAVPWIVSTVWERLRGEARPEE